MDEQTTQGLTWAGLSPDEHATKVMARARENVAKIPGEHREERQDYRLSVVDDRVDVEEHWVYESSGFFQPEDAVEYVRERYRGEYAHGLYEVEPVYRRYPGDREQTVPFGEPLVYLPEDEEPPDDDSDPMDDGTIGYDYYGPSWPMRDI